MSKPRVALTFDDGPSTWTPQVLDVLAEAGARATFFVIGTRIHEHEHLLQRMVREGHEIGIHGWDHCLITEMTNQALNGQIMATRNAIRHACRYEPKYWRSPWGRTPDEAADTIYRAGLRVIGLGVDSLDCDRDASQIRASVLPELKDDVIVCMHDGIAPNGNSPTKTRLQTVRALPAILEACMSVTLSELLA